MSLFSLRKFFIAAETFRNFHILLSAKREKKECTYTFPRIFYCIKMQWFVFGCTWFGNRIKAFQIKCNECWCNAKHNSHSHVRVCSFFVLFRLWDNLTLDFMPFRFSFDIFSFFSSSSVRHVNVILCQLHDHFHFMLRYSIWDNSFSLLPGRTKNVGIFSQCSHAFYDMHCHAQYTHTHTHMAIP